MARSILIGDIDTYKDWGLIVTKIEMNYPEPKTHYVDIPRGDGAIDLTEAMTGKVHFKNRIGKLEFDLLDEPHTRAEKLNEISSYIHGKKLPIVLPDEPDYVYQGRLSINKVQTSYLVNKIVIDLECEPYKLKPDVSDVSLTLIENLIPNGWDSFVPYGTEGEETRAPLEVFDDGYCKNILSFNELKGKLPDGQNFNARAYDVTEYKGNTVSITSHYGDSNSYDTVSIGLRNMNKGEWVHGLNTYTIKDDMVVSDEYLIPDDEDSDEVIRYQLYEYFGVAGATGGNAYHIVDRGIFLNGKTDKIYKHWGDLPDENKPARAWDNMAVHITPLENGLTRIQTWGGNNVIKLQGVVRGDFDKGVTQYRGLYLENNSEYIVRFDQDGGTFNDNPRVNWDKGSKGYNSFVGVFSSDRYAANVFIRYYGDNLDCIVGDPVIVEGDEYPFNTDMPKLSDIDGDGSGVAAYKTPYIAMPTIPTIETTGKISVKFKDSTERIILNKGKHIVPDLELKQGYNTIFIRGEKDTKVTITYQEGGL